MPLGLSFFFNLLNIRKNYGKRGGESRVGVRKRTGESGRQVRRREVEDEESSLCQDRRKDPAIPINLSAPSALVLKAFSAMNFCPMSLVRKLEQPVPVTF